MNAPCGPPTINNPFFIFLSEKNYIKPSDITGLSLINGTGLDRMRENSYLKAILFIFIVSLCITSLIVNVQAASWSWSKVTSPTKAFLKSVDMVSSTDGWIVGADGTIYHWQEEALDIPNDYLIIVGSVVVVVVIWFFLKKRSLKKKNL
jgi:hypothetical protein